jgi:alpha-beta hydrolase superfamily lysophospholipase
MRRPIRPVSARCSGSSDGRWRAPLTILAVFSILAVGVARSSAQSSQAGAKSIEESVTTPDGWRLPITYYPADDEDAPVAVLLHTKGDNRLVWGERRNRFAGYLNQAGFAVITVDLRKHGEAKDASGSGAGEPGLKDFQAMGLDLEAVKEFIFSEHQKKKLNMAKTAIVAAGMSAPVALTRAALDWAKPPYNDAPLRAAGTPRGQDVKAIVLLSPESELPGVSITRALRAIRDPRVQCAVLTVYGARVREDERAAKEIHDQLKGKRNSENQMLIQPLDTPNRGTDLIGSGLQIEPLIRGFLIEHVQKLDIPWRDRRSRLRR